ncbi:hypothetical protein LINPERPRIM_LOCUS38433, partial [Linum perenne]
VAASTPSTLTISVERDPSSLLSPPSSPAGLTSSASLTNTSQTLTSDPPTASKPPRSHKVALYQFSPENLHRKHKTHFLLRRLLRPSSISSSNSPSFKPPFPFDP